MHARTRNSGQSLDAARERTKDEGLTKAELKELEEDLKADMPEAVKRQLPENKIVVQEASLEREQAATPSRQGAKLDMPVL